MAIRNAILPQVLPYTLASVEPPDPLNQTVNQSIGLTDSVILANVHRLVSQRIFFFGANAPTGQAVSHNFFYEDAVNTFNFTSISGFNQFFEIKQYLGLTDRFFAPAIQQQIFGGPLSNASKVAESFVVDAANIFHWHRHDSPFNEALKQAHTIGNVFGWNESLFVHQVEDVENAFSFSSVADAAGSTYGRVATHSVIRQNLTYYITDANCPAERSYRPFVGDGPDGGFTPPSETPPTLGTGTMRFELSIPPAPLTSITLKNPEFLNTDDLTFTKIDRKTRGGERKIFSDPEWGTVQTLRLRVEKLCDKDVDDIISFLNASNGREVTLFDWEDRQWPGLILTSNTEVFTDENETTTFEIVFEGKAA